MDQENYNNPSSTINSDYYIPHSDWKADAELALTFNDLEFFNECNLSTQFSYFVPNNSQN